MLGARRALQQSDGDERRTALERLPLRTFARELDTSGRSRAEVAAVTLVGFTPLRT